mmetsp:Transcript_29518/g.43538  ORF Transcript_29518/g.43538 Transcript_29518/m.43538 type:complete len:102 (+) Transcript_29518:64-369(+)
MYIRNTLGQMPPHLCLSNKGSAEVIKVIYDAWPKAVGVGNESRKIPTDYWRGKGVDPALQAMWQKWYVECQRIFFGDYISSSAGSATENIHDNSSVLKHAF